MTRNLIGPAAEGSICKRLPLDGCQRSAGRESSTSMLVDVSNITASVFYGDVLESKVLFTTEQSQI